MPDTADAPSGLLTGGVRHPGPADIVTKPAHRNRFEAFVIDEGLYTQGQALLKAFIAFCNSHAHTKGRRKRNAHLERQIALFYVVLGNQVFFEYGIEFAVNQCTKSVLNALKSLY